MSDEHVLAYTVHHKGKRYLAGTAAEQIGEVAGEIGDHAWKGGKGPGKVTGDGNPRAGTNLSEHRVPTPSALPTPGPAPVAAPDGGDGEGGEGGAKKPASRQAKPSQ